VAVEAQGLSQLPGSAGYPGGPAALGRGMRPLPLVLFLAACGARRDEGDTPAAVLTRTNLGVAVHASTGSGERWLVAVREAEQGGLDLNGDGDARDWVVQVLEPSSMRLVSTGLALADDDDPRLLWACDGEAAAFALDERAQGGLDRNGDGDALDRVLVILEGDFARVHPFAVSTLVAGGTLVACAVDEAAQGGRDLDFDGDADGTALRVYDLADGFELGFGLRDSRPLAIADGDVVLLLAERPGVDLNGDGDDRDTRVFELFEGTSRLLHNTTLVLAGDAVASAGGTFGVSVSEAGQGWGDLSGDGDTDDSVYYVYSPQLGYSVNLGLEVPLHPPPVVDGERFLLLASESSGALDRNGDGDLEDWIVHVFEPGPGRLYDTGLASQGSATLLGGWIAVSVSEAMQGSSDLDGDSDADGNVVHAFELASGALLSLGLDAFHLAASGERLYVLPSEQQAAIDWNGDGDQEDRALFDWSAAAMGPRRAQAVQGELVGVQGSRVLLRVSERELGQDRTGDGDLEDEVLELFEVESGARFALGLAAGSWARLLPDAVLALVDEAAQGRDLNADGDRLDEVLHLVR